MSNLMLADLGRIVGVVLVVAVVFWLAARKRKVDGKGTEGSTEEPAQDR